MKQKGHRIKETEAVANRAWNQLQDYKTHCGQTLVAIKGRLAALENCSSEPMPVTTGQAIRNHEDRLNGLDSAVILLKKSLDSTNMLRQQVNILEAAMRAKGGLL
jgi:hypothetical protein